MAQAALISKINPLTLLHRPGQVLLRNRGMAPEVEFASVGVGFASVKWLWARIRQNGFVWAAASAVPT